MARRTSIKKTGKLNVIGPRIRQIREEKNVSQIDLARKLQRAGWDIAPEVLNRCEMGSRSITDIEMFLIAKALKIGLREFEN